MFEILKTIGAAKKNSDEAASVPQSRTMFSEDGAVCAPCFY